MLIEGTWLGLMLSRLHRSFATKSRTLSQTQRRGQQATNCWAPLTSCELAGPCAMWSAAKPRLRLQAKWLDIRSIPATAFAPARPREQHPAWACSRRRAGAAWRARGKALLTGNAEPWLRDRCGPFLAGLRGEPSHACARL